MTPTPISSLLPRGAGMYLASVIWGTWILVLNAAGLPGLYSIYVVALVWIAGTVGFLACLAALGRFGELPRLLRTWRVARWAVLIGVVDGIHSALFLTSFQMAVADGGSLLIPVIRSLSGVFTPLVALFLSREERFSPWYLAVGALATLGAFCIFGWSGFQIGNQISLLALSLVFVSMLLACVVLLLARVLAVEVATSGFHPLAMLSVQGLAQSLVLVPALVALPLLIPFPLAAPDFIRVVAFLALIGLSHITLASIVRLHAVKTISGQHSAIIGYLEPITSVIISILFFGEQATPGFILGSLLILAAAAAAQYVALRHSALKHRIVPSP